MLTIRALIKVLEAHVEANGNPDEPVMVMVAGELHNPTHAHLDIFNEARVCVVQTDGNPLL